MNLSANFTLAELTVTQTVLDNTPNPIAIANLQALVSNVLQPLRQLYGHPVLVNSGYRSAAVNKAVGGATNSQHMTGQAADIEALNTAQLFYLIRNHLQFDQLIWEGGDNSQPEWVHVSYRATHNRNQVLRMRKVNAKKIRSILIAEFTVL